MVESVRDNNIAALQQTLRSRGAGRVLVVKPGQLQNLKGIESLRSISSLPNLHQQLTDFVRARFGIEVDDILCDGEGKVAILSAANPSFLERVKNSNGNLEVLGHTVVWELNDEGRASLCLLKKPNNIAKLSSPGAVGAEPRKFEPFAIPSRESIKQRMEELAERYGSSPDLALLRKFFPDQPLIIFDSWIQINSAALKKFGVFPFLLIAEEAGENISAMHLPAVLDINAVNSPEFFTTLGIYIARKLKPLRPLDVNEFFTSLTLRPEINRSIGNIIDQIDDFLISKRPAPVEPIPAFLLDSSGQIGCSPLPNLEKTYLVLATLIMSRANDLTLARSEAIANSVGNFIEQGITSERDVSQLIEFIISNTPAKVLPEEEYGFDREITLLESQKRVVYKFDKLGAWDKPAEFLVTFVDGQEILLCSL